jgi:DNA-binding SARP family transcriptional activator
MDRLVTISTATPAELSIKLLGKISAAVNGREIRVTGRHAQALLALLVLQRRPRSREAIAADLWPDADGSSSAALRQALWLVRGAISATGADPDSILEADQDSIGLRPSVRLDLDASRFERLVRGRPAEPEQALPLYRGDLAEGLCHECFASDRERLSDAYEDALAMAAEDRLAAGDLGGARSTAEELLARDPLREEGHETLIKVYGASGSRSQVHRQFRRLRAVLEREIGVEPLPQTMAAYRIALAATVERSRLQAASSVFAPRHGMAAFAGRT